MAVPIAIAIAVLKYRLYDIDVVISRTLVYGSLAGFITAVYVGIVVGVGTLIGSGGQPNLVLSIIATATVAVAFHPVRERLQRGSPTAWSTASGRRLTRCCRSSRNAWRKRTQPMRRCRGWPASWPKAPQPSAPRCGSAPATQSASPPRGPRQMGRRGPGAGLGRGRLMPLLGGQQAVRPAPRRAPGRSDRHQAAEESLTPIG